MKNFISGLCLGLWLSLVATFGVGMYAHQYAKEDAREKKKGNPKYRFFRDEFNIPR